MSYSIHPPGVPGALPLDTLSASGTSEGPDPAASAAMVLAWLAALDQVGVAMLLLHPHGRVLHANRQARAHCQDNPLMCLAGRHLRMAREGDRVQFERALAQAGTGRRSLLLLRADGEQEAVALQPTVAPLGSGLGLILVLLSGREPANALSLRLFSELHRLTKAEHKVLRELALGFSPREVADTAGVALTTVRSQIQAIRDKTAARTLRELLQRVACLPPMLPPDLGRHVAAPAASLAAAE